MALIYVLENLINDDSVLYVNSEDDLYVKENVYDEMPAVVYRTTGIGAIGAPEYICVDLGSRKDITFVGIFNHNFTQLEVAGDELRLKGCDNGCPGVTGACDWDNPDCETDLITMPANACYDICDGNQPIVNFKNTYHKIECAPGHRYWSLEIIDQGNADGYLEIGEVVLGQWAPFHRGGEDPNWVHLQPGRADGPMYFMGHLETHHGVDWTNYYSDAEHFTLSFKNLNDPCVVDEIHAWLNTIQRAGGKFVIVPDDTKPFCYYVVVKKLKDFAERLMYGNCRELREWRLELKTLSHGIVFL